MPLYKNFKATGDNLVPQVFDYNQIEDNGSLTKQETLKITENKLIGVIIIESVKDKKRRYLKRSLQHIMIDNHNVHLSDKQVYKNIISNDSRTQHDRDRTDTIHGRVSFF